MRVALLSWTSDSPLNAYCAMENTNLDKDVVYKGRVVKNVPPLVRSGWLYTPTKKFSQTAVRNMYLKRTLHQRYLTDSLR